LILSEKLKTTTDFICADSSIVKARLNRRLALAKSISVGVSSQFPALSRVCTEHRRCCDTTRRGRYCFRHRANDTRVRTTITGDKRTRLLTMLFLWSCHRRPSSCAVVVICRSTLNHDADVIVVIVHAPRRHFEMLRRDYRETGPLSTNCLLNRSRGNSNSNNSSSNSSQSTRVLLQQQHRVRPPAALSTSLSCDNWFLYWTAFFKRLIDTHNYATYFLQLVIGAYCIGV